MTLNPKDDWCTPEEVIERVEQVAPIHLDPCWNDKSIVPCKYKFDGKEKDGLAENWEVPYEACAFVNPPYSRGSLKKWMEQCVFEASQDKQVIALVPAATGTNWWQEHCFYAKAICFWSGRIKFLVDGKPKGSPTFDSAVIYFGPYPWAFEAVFVDAGWVVRH